MKKIFSVLNAALCLALLVSCSNPSGGGSDDNSNTPPAAVYTVTFDSQDATTPATPATMTVTSPARFLSTLPTAPVKTGFNFGGWWTEKDGKGTQFTASTAVETSITVYAKWTTNTVYVVTFDSNGGSTVPSQSVEQGALAAYPDAPTKTGYAFGGWYTDTTNTTAWNFTTMKITKATTIYAKWNANTYTVRYDDQGATVAAGAKTTTVKFPATTVGSLPTPPVKTKYKFSGWWTETNGGGTQFTASTAVTANITVYAKWTMKTVYVVTFDSNGGSIIANQNIEEDSYSIKPDTPTKSGYTFDDWYTDNTFSVPWNFTTMKITQNATLYGKWIAGSYTSTLNPDGSITLGSYTGTDTLIVIPETIGGHRVTGIKDSAFSGNQTITSVSIPDSVTSIGASAFSGCSILTSVTIPNSVTSIGASAFSSCSRLTSVTIPNSVTSINDSTFYYCLRLSSVTIPDSVTFIGNKAFAWCTKLTSVTIPSNSVTSIGDYAFDTCSSLSTFTINAVTPPTLGLYVFHLSNTAIKVPAESVSAYQQATNWDTYKNFISAQ